MPLPCPPLLLHLPVLQPLPLHLPVLPNPPLPTGLRPLGLPLKGTCPRDGPIRATHLIYVTHTLRACVTGLLPQLTAVRLRTTPLLFRRGWYLLALLR